MRAVLTAHAHHDHALDTAAVAIETGAVVVGTPSVARLVGARGVPPERICVAGPRSMAFGPYRVTPFYVEHGPSPFYLRWLLDHELTESLPGPAWFGRYRDDNNLSFLIEHGGRRILVHPSAGAHNLAGLGADVVFLGIGRLGKMSPAEAETFLRATVGPKTRLLVPIHWDRFTTPLGAPLRKSPGFLDDVDLGFARVCAYAARTPHLQVLRMDMNAGLDLASGKRTGAVAALCVNGRVRRGF